MREAFSVATVQAILDAHAAQEGPLLPILHDVQEAFGFVPPDAVPVIANALNLSRAEVHGVITFYHHFRTSPPPRHVVQICRAEACQSMGADALVAHAERVLGCAMHGHSGDVALEPVFCLGQCATSPAITIDDKLHARVTPEKFDRLVARAKDAV
ncbi:MULTISPECIES: formate dehydrogenase subunit gamma [Pandoraea]|jgi:formate dehydrogenase subunit gamma|uniref:Formate dehydrogenase n=1 Tax=Pandoraea pnomenusa TaxID=93220 RepID=A0A378YY64_9BURK|nr:MULTISPECIES: formate dehydrogenase subunit gamma [Pandoraea]AHB06773.1 formate dehydrogenase [Pandoraea pnomenusa 3kgm]AHB77113.1 formate dehydrogenase subunit gamma [Pandoraea pnomenusa]AHN74499.1 formate dehydrogenase [Pandoraea pnomenusa]AIU28918.1 formate dehydrogenase [Pandoraea pnomenusa]ANC45893.1 formate dehydrogenase [Pandoraea pnomenusa]